MSRCGAEGQVGLYEQVWAEGQNGFDEETCLFKSGLLTDACPKLYIPDWLLAQYFDPSAI